MEYALFLGCKIPYFVPHYETATRLVCSELGVTLTDIEFNCCGYPVRNLDFDSYLLSAARNLALAEARGMNIVTPCKCCYGSLKKARYLLAGRLELRERINGLLAEGNLRYEGRTEVKHLLQVLYHDVGLETIKGRVTAPFHNLRIAAHYGCHALRPSAVMEFDDPARPRKFDQLVEVTGARSVEWSLKLQCCGNPLWGKNDELSKDLTVKKLMDGKRAGADYLCVACTYCQIQFDTVQNMIIAEEGAEYQLPSILYPQLLGLAMGLDADQLGIFTHRLSAENIMTFRQVQAAG